MESSLLATVLEVSLLQIARAYLQKLQTTSPAVPSAPEVGLMFISRRVPRAIQQVIPECNIFSYRKREGIAHSSSQPRNVGHWIKPQVHYALLVRSTPLFITTGTSSRNDLGLLVLALLDKLSLGYEEGRINGYHYLGSYRI